MGAPVGNKNATKAQPWSDALRRALLANNGKRLRQLADKLLAEALEGSVPAIKELGDRVEGKPAQRVEVTGADGEPLIPKSDPMEVARSIGFILAQAAR